ncbi:hypothetical protein M758_4G037700 [Ceratodon purpureus]|uniref:Uncharacterized protein n=1 Tax=Ceratodon purpureus TaxID=3225 RepID=A0A8T0I7K9_CERPU|nr:hypothetical protein KC19_4G041000 [Ceratodon purpureus]KAG0618085.1 hypothetical protein M758_4G037700 [Ceratodon purpureus]
MKSAIFLKTFLALLVMVVVTTDVAEADSVVEELLKNGLPVGLLPSSVKRYSIDKEGAFSVSLEGPCYAKIGDQLAYYDQNITGTLKFGSISSLDGIETKQLFVWLPVTGIYVDVPATPYIYFEVGVLTKRLSLAVFETPPKCSANALVTGLYIPSWIINGEFGGFRPGRLSRKALQR